MSTNDPLSLVHALNTQFQGALCVWARQHVVVSDTSKVSVKEIDSNNVTIRITLSVTEQDGSAEKLEQCELLRCHSDTRLDVEDALTQAVVNQACQAWEAIESLFTDFGNDDYIGEAVSQEEHATQAAQCAREAGQSNDVILGALLHDIGHLMGLRTPSAHEQMAECGTMWHEKLGAQFAQRHGMSPIVSQIIQGHVDAKRYLCYADKDYYDKLTDASKTTLTFQGGVMEEDEARAFKALEAFDAIIAMRQWDEAAKVPKKVVPRLSEYKDMVIDHIKGYNPVHLVNSS